MPLIGIPSDGLKGKICPHSTYGVAKSMKQLYLGDKNAQRAYLALKRAKIAHYLHTFYSGGVTVRWDGEMLITEITIC